MVEESAADAEGVGEMQTWHGGELVDRFAVHPNTFRVLLSDGVEKAVGFGEEAGWHAGVDTEGCKGEEVAKGYGTTGDGECVGIGGFVVEPAKEPIRDEDVGLA